MPLTAPAFEDTTEAQSPLIPPAFEDTQEAEAPLSPPAFEDTQEIVESKESQPLSDIGRQFVASVAKSTIDPLVMASRIGSKLPAGKLSETVSGIIGAPSSEEILTEMEGASARAGDEYGVNPKFQDTFLSNVARGFGQIVPAVAAGRAAPVVSALMSGEQGYQEAKSFGATGTKLIAATGINATTAFVTEKLMGIPKILGLIKGSKAVPKSIIKTALKSAKFEVGQELIEQVMQDLSAKGLYDPERKVFDWKKMATVAGVAAIVGGGTGGTLQAAENLSAPKSTGVIDPKTVAPKEQVQEVAKAVDESLAQLATEEPPAPSEIPAVTSETPQGTPIISAEEMQAVPAGTPEELQSAVPLGPRIVSTGIMTPEGIATGASWNTGHADISKIPGPGKEIVLKAMDAGMTMDEINQNKGFIVEENGKQRFVGRKEALEIARKSWQVDESVLYSPEKQGLISEALITPQNAVQEPQTTALHGDVPQQPGVIEGRVPPTESPERVPRSGIREEAQPKVSSEEEVAKELLKHKKQAVQAAKAAGATEPELIADQAIDEMRVKGSTDPALLATIARRRAIDQQRPAKKAVSLEEAPEPSVERGPRAEAVAKETASSIEEVISSMPETDQKVMRAYMESGGTDQEVATETGLTLDQVKKAKSRARQTLAQFVRSQGIGTRMAPGASNIREIQNARYTLASDIYEGLRQTGELSRSAWEKNVLREYGDIFDQQQLDDAWAVAQEVSSQFQEGKGRRPIPKIIDQLTGAKPGEGITSIKNEQADIERRARGLPAAMKAARRAQVGLWDETIRYMEENPQAQRELISKLNQDTRLTVNDRELMMLTHAKLEAENRYEEALKAVNESTTEQAQLEAMQMAREAEANLINIFDTRFFVATCRSCRMVPHLNPKWAREVGILAPPHEWGVVPRD